MPILTKIRDYFRSINSSVATNIVLLVAGVAVLFFQNDLHYFGRGHHAFLSSHGMTLAKNVSLDHYFLQYESRFMQPDGRIIYNVYGRFPVTAFALIKVVILCADGDLSMEIELARNLMNLFFIGSIFVVFLTVRQFDFSPPAAAAVALLAFSTYYLNYYNDMIFNDVPAMFGLLLAFHGMVVYQKTHRFPQLLVKSLIALSLGWQSYAILMPYIIFYAVQNLIKQRSLKSFVKSHEIKLALITFGFGVAILAVNFISEKVATRLPWSELPSVQKMKFRMGADSIHYDDMHRKRTAMGNFFNQQMFRIGRSSAPYLIAPRPGPEQVIQSANDPFVTFGILVVIAVFVCILFLKNRLLLLTLFASGFCWAFPMRYFVFEHDFQSLFYVGIPVLLFLLVIQLMSRFAKPLLYFVLILALIIFTGSNLKLNLYKADTGHADAGNIITADFQNIKPLVDKDAVVYSAENIRAIAGGWHSVEYYLAHAVFTETLPQARFIISRNPRYNKYLLTPHNRYIFLFRNPDYKPHDN